MQDAVCRDSSRLQVSRVRPASFHLGRSRIVKGAGSHWVIGSMLTALLITCSALLTYNCLMRRVGARLEASCGGLTCAQSGGHPGGPHRAFVRSCAPGTGNHRLPPLSCHWTSTKTPGF